ncbi:class I SAM-dependent methyltransferase [Streptomyces sp. H10-C2]|uniref:class I SAM-dependent methyltransferase n=1 Tax=unclassified Streptomyces TaxID=2593676 RepID=UPI0024B9C725|nr:MULTISPECIES: class I SAM-dependent methyltransferase [unclassified Streptomyces]MDJ0342766.1 class I SAM-dependent methyltransferase [Streptomyces sp. PH10-H1]MDJ0372444.1 class I SAM-dependent methyltransferase [Streptomyces sp. H10-C2]
MTASVAPQGSGHPPSGRTSEAAVEPLGESGLFKRLAPAGARVLDVGCGQGQLAMRLHAQGCIVTGVDTSHDALRAARAYRRGATAVSPRFFDLNADTPALMGLSGDPFDLIVCRMVYPLLSDPAAFFSRVQVLLAPGGALVVIDRLVGAAAEQLAQPGPGLTATAVAALTGSTGWTSVQCHHLDEGLTAFVLRTHVSSSTTSAVGRV